MKKYHKIFVIIAIANVLINQIFANEKQSASSNKGQVATSHEILDLSYLAQDVVYSFAASSDKELEIAPVRNVENDLIPVLIEYKSADEKQQNEQQPDVMNSDIAKTSQASAASISYSGMFMAASGDWYWGYDQDYDNFLSLLSSRADQGYRIESMDVYPATDNQSSLYAATWTKDGKWWAWVFNYDANELITQLDNYKQDGRRIVDIEYDKRNQKFGGVWTDDDKGWAWVVNYDYDSYVQEFETQKQAGRRPLDLNVYPNSDNTAFLHSGVWIGNSDNYGWAWAFNYEWSEFSALLDKYNSEGKRLIDYEKYITAQGLRYGGAWVDDNVNGGYSINYSNQSDFTSRIESRKNDDQMRPVKFEMYTDLDIGIEASNPVHPEIFQLAQNYPNPFNPHTKIKFSLPEPGFTTLRIYDLLGKEIATLINRELTPGQYLVPFNGERLASGIYIYRLEVTGDMSFTQVKKMSLIK